MTEQIGVLALTRRTHEMRVLAALRSRGPSSRAQLAEATRLSRTTLSEIAAGLIVRGAVVVADTDAAQRRGSGRPAALLAPQSSYSSHWAYDTMERETSRKLIAIYWGYSAMIDAEMGRIMEALERLGLAGDTAVAVTSDHGEFTGAHRLHDKGPAMHEDIYRTAGVLRVPGQEPGL